MSDNLMATERRDYEALRKRLIDVSGRTRLLNFKAEGNTVGAGIRLIATSFGGIFDHLIGEKPLSFAALPSADVEPPDEKPPQFQIALRRAKESDQTYLADLGVLGAEGKKEERARAERDLRDRLRNALGMIARPTGRSPDLAGWAALHGIDPDFELPLRADQSGQVVARALMLPETIHKRLIRIEKNVRTVEQETGVSTLHLAFGFLEWLEAETSAEPMVSPLLLLPVSITHEKLANGAARFQLLATDSAPQINLSLQLRLAEDFRLEIPGFDPDVNDPVPCYIERINTLIQGRRGWQVRNNLTVAPFSFTRIAMYHDLAPDHWPTTGGPAAHPLVRPILRGITDPPTGEETERPRHAPLYDVDDEAVAGVAPILVHDADSSQHSALIDAMKGRNLAIQGPPGTGKSQTIANLIANALYQGKSILFVSEKMAALDVVKDRLDKVGLGDFCLALHATGAKPAAVIEALKRRDAKPPPRTVAASALRAQMMVAQTTIVTHLKTMHQEIGPYGDTSHRLIGRIASRDRTYPDLPRRLHAMIDQVPKFVDPDLSRDAERLLEDLEAASQPVGRDDWQPSVSPFHALERGDLSSAEQAELFERMTAMVNSLETARSIWQGFGGLIQIDTAASIDDSWRTLRQIKQLTDDASAADHTLLARLRSRDAIKRVSELAKQAEAVNAARDQLHQRGRLPTDSAGIRALHADAHAIAISASTIAQVRAAARAASAMAAELAECREAIETVVALFRLADRTTLATVRHACQSIDHLRSLDPLAALHRGSGLENHVTALDEAAQRQVILIADLKSLEERFDLDGLDAGTCRGAAETLRAAGAFGFLLGAVRQATLIFKTRWRGGQMPPRNGQAEWLERIALVLDAATSFGTNAVLRSLFGPDADLMAIPLPRIALAAVWQRGIVEALVAKGGGPQIVTALILMQSSDLEQLRFIAPLAQRFAALLNEEHLYDFPWRDVVLRKSSNFNALGGVVQRIDALGLPDDLAIASLLDIADQIDTVFNGMALLQSPEATALVAFDIPVETIRATLRCATAIHDLAGDAAPRLLNQGWEHTQPDLEKRQRDLSSIIDDVATQADQIAKLGLSKLVTPLGPKRFGELRSAVAACLADPDDLPRMVDFVNARTNCLKNPFATLIFRGFEGSNGALRGLPEALHWLVATAQVHGHAKSNQDVFGMSGQRLSALRSEFAEADRKSRARDASLVIQAIHKRGHRTPDGNSYGTKKTWTERALLDNEFSKQKRFVQVRDLLARAPRTIEALVPCLMMSPLTVAQYLSPGRTQFDLVIMDEASQVRPEDALGALLRGKQVVVVGDEKQLPPTNFFDRKTNDDDDADEDDSVVDGESVLALAARAFAPQRLLMWHYRSQHETLINFSNQEFYDDKLVVFPARAPLSATLGIEIVRVPGVWHEQTNQEEADAVIATIVQFVRAHPSLSVGIVTMNGKQRDLIEQKIEDLDDDVFARFQADWSERHESFFVKNLENVQGDERDVIFVSFGWGRTKEGVFHQRFNLVNRADGHRRLNVLFTRAKRKIVLFTGLDPKNIIFEEGKTARGVRVLRQYLEYAEAIDLQTRSDVPQLIGTNPDFDPGDPDSPFEQSVGEALRACGYRFRYQVGSAGYRIDIGILFPDTDRYFAIGIECDGATYHRAASARDRDRLRQEALERLGWRILRVWSTDWYKDWRGQFNRLRRDIDAALSTSTEVESQRLVSCEPKGQTSELMIERQSASLTDDPLDDEEHPRLGEGVSPDHSPTTPTEPISIADRLRQFRETVVMQDFPGSEPERNILREAMIAQAIKKQLNDPADFTTKIPEHLRIRTDGRQMRYLEDICEIIAINGAREVGSI